jgi:acyl-coenzyme A synthetase/AMP-(fatty) acid ligase
MKSFDPEDLLRTIEKYRPTFTSLVPTHYRMMLDLPEKVRNAYDVGSVRQLLISSAPAARELKLEIMDFFPGVELWEAYGTTEGGMVTLLRPEDQLKKLGSIGKECFGVDRIKLLDDDGRPVEDGRVGELWYRTPMLFDGYLGEPEKTASAFRGEWSSAGDMARRDGDGYYYLVDRKENMIITGGENVYPAEVEKALESHPAVKEKAVIGLPDRKWGEIITAVIVLHEGYEPGEDLARDIINHCRRHIAAFMRPRIAPGPERAFRCRR